ncbi:MAG: hypothetical protein ACK4SQ_15995 [Allorhizobium sp.]
MAEILEWPRDLLVPRACKPNVVPFTRSGGRTLGGVKPSVRTDLGFWKIELADIVISTRQQQRAFEAIKGLMSGSAGQIAVPVYAPKRAPYEDGVYAETVVLSHDDDSLFDDGAGYSQGQISAVSVGSTPLGATVIRIRMIKGDSDLVGTLFSYNHALYTVHQLVEVDGDVHTVRISPTVRELIPSGSDLEFDEPTCLCNLSDDSVMDDGENFQGYQMVSVSFVEDTDSWSRQALGLT